jgi:hypothetical protein
MSSTTDRKGVIPNGNDVFVRVSGHTLENLRQPHNIIRHPDAPGRVRPALGLPRT